jgi:two-component system, OmpR family, sensor histidine kinase KdpD
MKNIRSAIERYGYVFAVVCIATSTAIFLPGRVDFAKGQWSLLYLLVVGLVAGLSGVRPALLAAVLAFLCWNFFLLPPYGTFRVADPKDWLSLFVFLVVAVAMGAQAGRLREREAEALAREREMALLNDFGAHLVSETSVTEMADVLLAEVRQVTGARCAALFLADEHGELGQFRRVAEDLCPDDPFVAQAALWAYRQAKAVGLPYVARRSAIAGAAWPISVDHGQAGAVSPRLDMFIGLQSAHQQEGVLYVGEPSDGEPYAPHDARLLVAVANQTAAFLERKRLQAGATQADVLREADRLKSTLISSVSHELKTPVASITATLTNLLEQDTEWSPDNVRHELEALRDDADRLNSSIGALLDLSRLESAAWEPAKDRYEFGEVLGTAISKLPQKHRSRIEFLLPDDLPHISVDFQQWARVLENLLENALYYSPAGSPVRVGASATESAVLMWVEDEGPGVSPEDRERIFEKFFRGDTSTKAPAGTGLGLAVTREIVRFHGGRIWVEDVTPHGARFVVSLPRQEGIADQ